jgi:hypothetical protein
LKGRDSAGLPVGDDETEADEVVVVTTVVAVVVEWVV